MVSVGVLGDAKKIAPAINMAATKAPAPPTVQSIRWCERPERLRKTWASANAVWNNSLDVTVNLPWQGAKEYLKFTTPVPGHFSLNPPSETQATFTLRLADNSLVAPVTPGEYDLPAGEYYLVFNRVLVNDALLDLVLAEIALARLSRDADVLGGEG